MIYQIYTVIFLQFINRTSKLQNYIVVACVKFLGAHKHLPVFGVFNYIHHTLSWGVGITLLPPVKLVIGNMHYRGMKFCGAHVWKMSHR